MKCPIMISPILSAYAPHIVAALTAVILLPYLLNKSFKSKDKS